MQIKNRWIMKKILELKNVKVNFKVEDDIVKAVGGVSFDVYENEILCIIGETGCGKSVLGASILKILPKNAFVQGKIIYNGEDILEMSDREYIKLRGKEIAVVPQSPVMSLDFLMRVGKQIYEAYRVVDKTEKKEDIYKKIKSLLKRLDLPVERNIEKNYPCELSGGMNQRVLIAMGTITKPKLLIVDEPTKGIDWILRKEVINIFKDLKKEFNCTILMITHDIDLAENISDRIGVMYEGVLMELCNTKNFINNPVHEYSKILLNSTAKRGFLTKDDFKYPKITGDVKNLLDESENTYIYEVEQGHFVRGFL